MHRTKPLPPATQALPLAGLRVVEFTHMMMGPTCGMVLADMGAGVIGLAPMPARISPWVVYDAFTVRNGEQVFLAAASDAQWLAFCDALSLDD